MLGAGGHGKVVVETALETGRYEKVAFLDDGKIGQTVIGREVKGGFDKAVVLTDEFEEAFVALGDNKLRLEWIRKLIEMGYVIPVIIHPKAMVSRTAVINEGTCVFANAVINADASIGTGCIINTSAVIEHDCVIGDGTHVSCNVSLGGTVRVGNKCLIGIGSTIINNIRIGDEVTVGAGAVVISDVLNNQKVVGVPAKSI